jgi:hypothetical protein
MSCLCLAPLLTSPIVLLGRSLAGRTVVQPSSSCGRLEQSDDLNRSWLSFYFLLPFQLQCGTMCSDRVALVAYAISHLQMQVNNYKLR